MSMSICLRRTQRTRASSVATRWCNPFRLEVTSAVGFYLNSVRDANWCYSQGSELVRGTQLSTSRTCQLCQETFLMICLSSPFRLAGGTGPSAENNTTSFLIRSLPPASCPPCSSGTRRRCSRTMERSPALLPSLFTSRPHSPP
ncbi:hypothetical protein CPAR01_10557 [Colletotrichum paranaense]|uniref:Uncharacterized protein n=1 Tax=Colletotrichum paranaense TaxID=1914294 RepID=A0ABQ9SEC4_9PEZI|nr:uncharacterized protein CPAR01_10557 [Colletotrichum paranaense]KAK1533849.1 hypothetical protein CPAR01_10557 [Colletotrichum paranaense]